MLLYFQIRLNTQKTSSETQYFYIFQPKEIQIRHFIKHQFCIKHLNEKNTGSLTVVYLDGRCKLKMRAGIFVTLI